ncbi:MAG: hypothetical protein ACHQ53_10875 [Polyangiales bacterium]
MMDKKALAFAILALAALGCETKNIPNTRVEDTTENREVIDFVEKYRHAVEDRDSAGLLQMASQYYYDDMGTPAGEDDVDYDTLKVGLDRLRKDVISARYQISYRGLTYASHERVLIDLLYTGWFKVTTPDGPQWRRRLEPHRIVVAREDGHLRIVSGM